MDGLNDLGVFSSLSDSKTYHLLSSVFSLDSSSWQLLEARYWTGLWALIVGDFFVLFIYFLSLIKIVFWLFSQIVIPLIYLISDHYDNFSI